MATFVTTIETEAQREVERGERVERGHEYGFGALLAGGLTLFAVAVDGYHPYAEDGGLYMAGVKRLLDPALYPHGVAFVLEPMRFSLFAPTVAGLVRLSHVGLPTVLPAVHLASVWGTLFAAWMLVARCWRGRAARAGAVVLLACWLTLPVAGTALLLMDPYVTARSFSTPCMVLALVGALEMTEGEGTAAGRRRGLWLWLGSMVLGAAMHPLMAAYALGATMMLVCARASRIWGTAGLAGTALALAGCLQALAKPESADYVRVALTRTYWFPAEWSWYEWVGLGAPLVLLAAAGWGTVAQAHVSKSRRGASGRRTNAGILRCAQNDKPGGVWGDKSVGGWGDESGGVCGDAEALARMAVAVGLTAAMVAILFARGGGATHLVARMQPLRAFQIVYLAMILLLGARLGERVLRGSVWRWVVAVLLLGGTMLGAERVSFANSNHLEMPRVAARNVWVQAFLWVRENTPKDALFALDADYINARGEDAQCFRAIAERSVLPDYSKDGGEASIAPELTEAWKAGQAAQQGLSAAATTDAERVARLAPLGVTWMVLQAGAETRLDCPYANAAVKVCRLR